jgi:hypothetical protein
LKDTTCLLGRLVGNVIDVAGVLGDCVKHLFCKFYALFRQICFCRERSVVTGYGREFVEPGLEDLLVLLGN